MRLIKKFTLFIGSISLFVLSANICAQTNQEEKNEIDSLTFVSRNPSTHDTDRAKALNYLGEIFAASAIDTIIYYSSEAQKIAEKRLKTETNKQTIISLRAILATSYNNIGYVHMNKGRNNLALQYYFLGLKMEQENHNKQGMASAYNNIGLVNHNQGNIPAALEYYHKSLQIKEEFADKKGMAMSLNNIGFVHREQGDDSLAIEYYTKAFRINKEVNNKRGMAMCLNNIGLVYFDNGDIVRAEKYYKESLKLKEEIDDKKGIANSLHNIGKVFLKKNELDSAKNYFERSLQIRKNIEDKGGIGFSYIELGDYYYHKNNLREAQQFFRKGLAIGREIGAPELIQKNSALLSRVSAQLGNWKEAYDMNVLAEKMRDSIASESAFKAAAQQEAKYKYEKERVAAELKQSQKNAIAEQEKQKQRYILYSVIAGLSLLSLFFILLFKRYKVSQEQNTIIRKQKHLIEEKHKEITDSINYAERIQRSLLANQETMKTQLNEFFILFKPKDIVSGDFYWCSLLNNNAFALVTADSTGHGVPGAIMSILNIACLNESIKEGFVNPSEILNRTRKEIISVLKRDGSKEGGKDGMDCSLCVYDFKEMKLYVSAANNPVWIVRGKEVIEIKPDKMPVGKHDKQDVSFTQHEIELQKGDVIYTLTDGFPDQFGGKKGKKFMSKNLRELLAVNAYLPMHEQKQLLENTFSEWIGNIEQVDDVTVIGVRV